ncbi:MAG: hypothetical protein AMXMBFR42_02060 [Burkholderiales bacterium]
MQQKGFGSDAGRQSLTEVGAVLPHAAPRSTCRLCGVGQPSGTRFCPNCGAIQRVSAWPDDAVARDPAASRPTPAQRLTRDPTPLTAAPRRTETSSEERGERLVAWSALGVLAVAAFLAVERVGDLRFPQDQAARGASDTTRTTAQPPAPTMAAAAPESPLPNATAAGPQARSASTQGTLSAARVAAKPHARPKPRTSRNSPPREVPRPAVAATEAPPRAAEVAEPAVVAVLSHETAPRSRWDAMHDEIATCSTSDFLDGAICRQKVRIRYCPGWWGQTEDCPTRWNGYGG